MDSWSGGRTCWPQQSLAVSSFFCFSANGRRLPSLEIGIVGKKRDFGILDPVIFSGKIRKNRKNSEKYFQKFGKILVKPKKRSSLKFGEKIRKNTENSKKYPEKVGKILKIRKNTLKNFGKKEKIWKN